MPITQATMVELMHESRAAIQNNLELRYALLQYLSNAKDRYPSNRDLGEVCVATMTIINMHPQPDDRATYRNEWHYRKVGGNNDTQRIRQALRRRQAGVLTQVESMERLALLNAARRSGDMSTQTYEQFNRGEPQQSQYAKPSKGLILPRDDPADKELEFETPEELAPIANLPAGAVNAIIDPLMQGENNSQEGIDNPADLPDDSNGNPAKESG